MLVPCAAHAADPPAKPQEAPTAPQDDPGDIIVTASRRGQSAADAPYNISAFSGEALAASGVTDIATLSRFAAGITALDLGAANRTNRNPITIRGINVNGTEIPARSDLAVPTVSQYLGEAPVQFPIKYFDVERVELLRGPQGTLYGSGSLAGTIRVLPVAPALDRPGGYGFVSAGALAHSGKFDTKIEGAINIPIVSERLALRVAGGWQRDAGFVDATGRIVRDANGVPVRSVASDISSGFVLAPVEPDANDADYTYFRAALRFRPSDVFDATLSYNHQNAHADNPQEVNANFPGTVYDNSFVNYPGSLYPNNNGFAGGRFPNGSTVFPASGQYAQTRLLDLPAGRDIDIGNLEATVDLGFASVTSSTTYSNVDSFGYRENTSAYSVVRRPSGSPLASSYGYFPRLLVDQLNTNHDEYLTQEVRLVSKAGGRIDYTIGGYYQKQKSRQSLVEREPGLAQFLGIPPGSIGSDSVTYTDGRNFTFSDVAVFGEGTWHITNRWQATGGFRHFWQRFGVNAVTTFPVCGSACANDGLDPTGLVEVTDSRAHFESTIFKANTSYKFSDKLLGYFTFSQGFRRGGASGVPLGGNYASLPKYLLFQPDKTNNYEVGIKGRFGPARFSASAFWIDWQNFQYEVGSPSAGAQLIVNGKAARSRGVELEASTGGPRGFSANLGYSYVQAEVTENFVAYDLPYGAATFAPSVPVAFSALNKGDRLPGVPAHTVTGQVGYGAAVSTNLMLRAQVDVSYRNSAYTSFNASDALVYARINGFAVVNASVALLREQRWTATLFANNIFDTLGATAGDFTTFRSGLLGAHRFVTRPRTLGLSFRYSFD